jgi:pimeloyl-ACP methyl ester carboxylesterase
MTRRTWLWILGAASFALFAVLAALDARMQEVGGWGIIDFELAGSEDRAAEIREDWEDEGRDAARLSLWLDFPYLVLYGAFFALVCAAVRDIARRQEWRRLAAIGGPIVYFPIGAAALDAVEDVGLLLALDGRGGSVAPSAAAVFAIGKFALINAAMLYVAVGLVRRAWRRFPRSSRLGLGAIVLLLAALVVNQVLASSETERAEAGAGRIVDLPGGDLHVTDEGPRSDSAVVLLHGFACSANWWERAGRMLQRGHRVIRVDLLGHGRSEKPKDGYGMDEQAQRVIAALRKLGVRRAVVAGHSMGGYVAVSAAEQDRGLVRGVVIVDADERSGEGPGAHRLLLAPLVGPAVYDLIPESTVKESLEVGFADGVEVPDQFVEDARRLTYPAYAGSANGGGEFLDERPLDERMTAAGTPLTVIFGAEDEVVDPGAIHRWDVPGARLLELAGVGHSPHYERPRETSAEITRLARSALARPPRDGGGGTSPAPSDSRAAP